jgi:hypothetical protein
MFALHLAGVPVPTAAVLVLAELLDDADDDELAAKLRRAIERRTRVLALELDERTGILAALEEPPDGLAELRAVLLQEHVWRLAEGL